MSDPSAEEQEQSLARIEAGGIPLSAERRLSELREGSGSFTSDLSVADFALCRQLGLRPLSQVMGSSIYQMGYQGAWGVGYGGSALIELDTLSEGLNEVRERSFARLAEEARHVGADAVVGVHARTTESELNPGSLALEHVTVGTAVHRESAKTSRPILTELSVADYVKLLQAGIEPCGIVAWSSVFFASYAFSGLLGAGAMQPMGTMANYELREFTQAIYGAREAVMQRITAQAGALGATGVVGVRIGHTVRQHTLGGGMAARERSGVMVTFNAIGTAIQEHGQATVQPPKPVIDLFN
jgi:uncharacterized protein YbjQ (UPF0145 family)